MSTKKINLGIIQACEKEEFDQVIKTYLKEVYNYTRVVITDGVSDAGLDIKVFDFGNNKVQYQMTIQKSQSNLEKNMFEKKLFDDVKKAQENYEKYGYSNNLFFFYSHTLTNKAIRNYAKKALEEYKINLTIVEANQIAEEALDYLQLQKKILDMGGLNITTIDDTLFPDEDKNLLFDLVSFGKPSDYKLQIVEAFVLQMLFKNKKTTLDNITIQCQEKFKNKENHIFYEKLIARLQSSKKITKDSSKTSFILTIEEENRIKLLNDQFETEEKSFIIGIDKILKEFNQHEFIEEYIMQLKRIYVDNFHSDMLLAITNNTDLSSISRDFLNFINKKIGDKERGRNLAIKLFEFCKENTFIQKFSAGKVFSEATNVSRIDNYINTKKRIFIDTQIALHGLCFFYNTKSNYNNYFFKTSKSLIEFCKTNKIKLYLPQEYQWEVQNHLRDALNLIPFTHLPNFEKLGNSRNVFYNFYLHQRKVYENELTYSDFFEKFKFNTYDRYTTHNDIIESYLSNIGIIVFKRKMNYNIEETKRLIQYELISSSRYKHPFSLNNDAIVIEFLSDNDIEIHPQQPIFLSWDKTFFKVQEEYFRKHPQSQRWFLMTPSKFIDQYSLLQFSIDSEVLTSDIISMLSNEIIQNTHTLLDTISFILNPNDEVGLEYTTKLADIRDNEIHRIREQEIVPPEDFEGEAVIDDVFYRLSYHYQKVEMFESFKNIFLQKDFINTVLAVITKAVNSFYESKRFDDKIYTEFDNLMNELKSRYRADNESNLK